MIAIHNKKHSFSELWIGYCSTHNIPYKIVDCYQSDIISQLKDCDALMWHHHHANYKDVLFAKQLLFSLHQSGKKVFPDFNTNWHFDDKVGQKYLLEAIGAPLVPSYVFYTKHEAINWANSNAFPKVFKLRGGAGSANVRLVKSKNIAKKLINQAFERGFSHFNRLAYLDERLKKYKAGRDTLWGVCKGIGRLIISTEFEKMSPREKGYIYFQDFIPNNQFDIRVIVIGNKAFAIKRMVRKNDFRASGSGSIIYKKEEIDIRCVKIALETSEKLKSQSLAYDFVFNDKNEPLIVEISYGFSPSGYFDCPGYWDNNLNWREEDFDPYGWMVELVLEK